ncbi:metal-dependent amidase/aminoacylase/carboxypeptidase [Corynebacterium lactis RW2-5]|uniref:Metal-dependent amidase/aminoacylase/carboxypeptidase n=1 Tax=Corynebacterium lactis RW2-5 TaxID=1408189 RepID=A0A0K2H0L6_9CORY|nr:metal-dependent amidase/aminoacylase/carboxypeptidase [Corynebacterium lactis RW2-5]
MAQSHSTPSETASDSANRVAELIRNHTVDLSWQKDTYRHLHQHPELSMAEANTAEYIAEMLRQLGTFTVHEGVGGHGVVGVMENGPGPVVLFRADIDALPVEEATGLDFASTATGTARDGSQTSVMHACGHDMHMTAGLGLATVMAKLSDEWSGTFIALFQPSEELASGAQAMVDDGLATLIPTPDVCFGQHVVPGPAGRVMSMPGPALAGCDTISITLHGRSAHGSMPHNSVDSTYLAAAIVLRLQGIVGREIPPSEFGVISVGTLQSGNSNNTIPGQARIVLNIRYYSNEVRAKLIGGIERVVRGECMASGTDIEPVIDYSDHGEVTDNSSEAFERIRPVFDAVFGDESVDAQAWTASEDFSNIPRALGSPYVYWTVGATPRDQWDAAVSADRVVEDIPSNHMPNFLPDFEPTVHSTTTAAASAVLAYLAKN